MPSFNPYRPSSRSFHPQNNPYRTGHSEKSRRIQASLRQDERNKNREGEKGNRSGIPTVHYRDRRLAGDENYQNENPKDENRKVHSGPAEAPPTPIEKTEYNKPIQYDPRNPQHVLLNDNGLVLGLNVSTLEAIAKQRQEQIDNYNKNVKNWKELRFLQGPSSEGSEKFKELTKKFNEEYRRRSQGKNEAEKKQILKELQQRVLSERNAYREETENQLKKAQEKHDASMEKFDAAVRDWQRERGNGRNNQKVLDFLKNLPSNPIFFLQAKDGSTYMDRGVGPKIQTLLRTLKKHGLLSSGTWKWTVQGKQLLHSLGYDVGLSKPNPSVFSGELKENPIDLELKKSNVKDLEDTRTSKKGIFRVIVAGSREFTDYEKLKTTLDKVLANVKDEIIVVSGGARGADRLGERYAQERKYKLERFPADWDKHGKSAGYRRNETMAQNADAAVVFNLNESKGSRHMIEVAIKNKLEVRAILDDLLVGNRNQILQVKYTKEVDEIKKSIIGREAELRKFEGEIKDKLRELVGPEYDRGNEKEKQAIINTNKELQEAIQKYTSTKARYIEFKQMLSQAERTLEEFTIRSGSEEVKELKEQEQKLQEAFRDTKGTFRRLSKEPHIADTVPFREGDFAYLPLREIPIDYLMFVDLGINPEREYTYKFTKNGKQYAIEFPTKYVYVQQWGTYPRDKVKEYLRSEHGRQRLREYYGHEFASTIEFLNRGGQLHKEKKAANLQTHKSGNVSTPPDAVLGYKSAGFLTSIRVTDEHQGEKELERSQKIQSELKVPAGLSPSQLRRLQKEAQTALKFVLSDQEEARQQKKSGRLVERDLDDRSRKQFRQLYEHALDLNYSPEKAKNFALKWLKETDPNSKVWNTPPQFFENSFSKAQKSEIKQEDYLHYRDWIRRNLSQYKMTDFIWLFFPPKDMQRGYTKSEEAQARKQYYILRAKMLQTDPLDVDIAKGSPNEPDRTMGTKAGWRADDPKWRAMESEGPWLVAEKLDRQIEDAIYKLGSEAKRYRDQTINSRNRENLLHLQVRTTELFHDTKIEKLLKEENSEGLTVAEISELQNLSYWESFEDNPEAIFARYMQDKIQHALNLFTSPHVTALDRNEFTDGFGQSQPEDRFSWISEMTENSSQDIKQYLEAIPNKVINYGTRDELETFDDDWLGNRNLNYENFLSAGENIRHDNLISFLTNLMAIPDPSPENYFNQTDEEPTTQFFTDISPYDADEMATESDIRKYRRQSPFPY